MRPSRISPSCSSSSRRSFCSARHSCTAARSERITRLRRRLISITLKRSERPSYSASWAIACSRSPVMPTIWLSGTKALTPSTLTSSPPLLLPVTRPSKTSPSSCRRCNSCQPCSPRARSTDSSSAPPSASESVTKTCTMSPVLSSSRSGSSSERISSGCTTPSDFAPTSTINVKPLQCTTTPSITSPRCGLSGSRPCSASSASIESGSGPSSGGGIAAGSAGSAAAAAGSGAGVAAGSAGGAAAGAAGGGGMVGASAAIGAVGGGAASMVVGSVDSVVKLAVGRDRDRARPLSVGSRRLAQRPAAPPGSWTARVGLPQRKTARRETGGSHGLAMAYFPQGVAPPVSSALRRFTAVFGMGTGGATAL